MQIVESAINESKQQNRTVTIDEIDMKRAGVSRESVIEYLYVECEGSDDAETDFWGVDCDGNEWRVCVEVAS